MPRPRRSQDAVLAATLDVIAEHGVSGATVGMVAGHQGNVGASKATIYRHWGSRARLIDIGLFVDLVRSSFIYRRVVAHSPGRKADAAPIVDFALTAAPTLATVEDASRAIAAARRAFDEGSWNSSATEQRLRFCRIFRSNQRTDSRSTDTCNSRHHHSTRFSV